MTSLINFSGLATGIDSSALIKSLLDRDRAVRVTPLQNQVTHYQDTNTAFSKLKGLIGSLNSATQKLRAVNGSILGKTASSSDETIVSAAASSSAANGTYTLNVTQLAKNATFSFNDRYASTDTAINSSINNGASAANRTVTVQVGTGSNQETVAVELTNTTTASDFVSQFNASSTKATASLVNVGTSAAPSYAISIISNNQGTDSGQLSVSVGSEVTGAGSGAFTSNTLSQATNATFTLTGVSGTISKSSNSVADVVPGVTFNFQSTGTATITVGDDKAATSSALEGFVNAYNDVINFVNQNDQVTRQEDGSEATNVFGPLAGTQLDENLVSTLKQALVSSGISGHSVNTLADLGIATQKDGTLKFDSSALNDAISSDSEAVRTITQNLGESLGAVDGGLAQYSKFGGLIDIASNANADQIKQINTRISDIQTQLDQKQQDLTNQFARLEALTSQLQSQQTALTQVLPH